MHELVPLLHARPADILTLLEACWALLCDRGALPSLAALSATEAEAYLRRVRIVVHRNIAAVGAAYARYCPPSAGL